MLTKFPLLRWFIAFFVALGIHLVPLHAEEVHGRAAATNTAPRASIGNLPPAEALKVFETEPGFIVTLVAAEPLTMDPVALAFDERGRLFVAEGGDYPEASPDGRPLVVHSQLYDG